MLWRFSDQERPKHVSNLFCTHHVVFNNIYKMRKECLPEFNQRRFYEGSGKSKKESICETETGKQHNFTLFKITVLYTCTSKQLTIVLASRWKFFMWFFLLWNVVKCKFRNWFRKVSSCERQFWRESRRGWYFWREPRRGYHLSQSGSAQDPIQCSKFVWSEKFPIALSETFENTNKI